jgi:hypothetical protein
MKFMGFCIEATHGSQGVYLFLQLVHHLADITQTSITLWILGCTPAISKLFFHLDFFHYG